MTIMENKDYTKENLISALHSLDYKDKEQFHAYELLKVFIEEVFDNKEIIKNLNLPYLKKLEPNDFKYFLKQPIYDLKNKTWYLVTDAYASTATGDIKQVELMSSDDIYEYSYSVYDVEDIYEHEMYGIKLLEKVK